MAISISQLNDQLASRLGDTGRVYWTNEENNRTIKEALLTFNAISGYWKRQVLVETKNGQSFYNLLDASDIKTGFDFIKISLIYNDILSWLDDNLIGYLNIASTEEVLSLITNAINQLQSNTALVLERSRFNIQIGQPVAIDDRVLDIVRAYYIGSQERYKALQLADESRVALIKSDYTLTNGKPRFYTWSNLSASLVDIFPRPNENGFLELIYITAKTGLINSNTDCLVPNNLVPYIKFKVLADIFGKDGPFKDPFREAYCIKRWQEGLLVGNHYGGIVNIKLDGVNKSGSSLADFDLLRFSWPDEIETVLKKINAVAIGGYNILAINRKPINAHSVLIEIIANAPTDDLNIDLDIQPDYLPVILEYCIHLSSIKDGIAAIQKTQPYLESFVKTAVAHNAYLQRMKISYFDLLQKTKYPLRQAKVLEEENAA